jgi:hypothetical protein
MMPLYTAPKQFVTRLKAFDSKLRIRWSDVENRYRIERKVARASASNVASARTIEDRIAARDGYVLVLHCKQNQLDARVLFTLWHDDLWRVGGADAWMNQLQREDEEREAIKRERFLSDIDGKAREAYRYANTIRTLPENKRHTAPVGGMSING